MRKAFLTGRLGRDAEIFTPEGSEYSCLKFSIANGEESKKNSDGQ